MYPLSADLAPVTPTPRERSLLTVRQTRGRGHRYGARKVARSAAGADAVLTAVVFLLDIDNSKRVSSSSRD